MHLTKHSSKPQVDAPAGHPNSKHLSFPCPGSIPQIGLISRLKVLLLLNTFTGIYTSDCLEPCLTMLIAEFQEIGSLAIINTAIQAEICAPAR